LTTVREEIAKDAGDLRKRSGCARVCAIAAWKDKETKAMPRSAMAIVSSRGRLRTRLARSSSSSSSFPSLLCAISCTF